MAEPAHDRGTPRWVKVFGGIALAVVLLFLVLFIAGGPHGPGRHASAASSAGYTPRAESAPQP
jgi:hypothetical protein